MSLIQKALEKTNRVQETRTTNPSPAPKTYDCDPMGAALEQELTQIQQAYAKRRRLYWNVFLGVLSVCFIAGLFYVGVRQIPSGGRSAPVRAVASIATPIAAPVVAPIAASVAVPIAVPVAAPIAASVAVPIAVPVAAPIAVPVEPQIPLEIQWGNIYRLTGIMIINGKPMAVINGEIVSEGDSLSNKTVVKAIGNGEVRLDVQGKEIKLTL